MTRKLLIGFIGWLILMTVGVSAYGHPVKLTPQQMGDEFLALLDGELRTELVLNDPFDLGYQEFIIAFGEPTELAAYKLFLAEPQDLSIGLAYDVGDGFWQETVAMATTPLLQLQEGWNRIELGGVEVQKVKVIFYGTAVQTRTGLTELEFWGENSQEPVELFSATQVESVALGKSSGSVQDYTYQIPVERHLVSLQNAELVYQSYDLEYLEGQYNVNEQGLYSLTAQDQHLRTQKVLNERLIAPHWVEQGTNQVLTRLGDSRKNGFELQDVGLKLHFDRGQLEIKNAEIYQNGLLIDQLVGRVEPKHPGGLRVANLLDGQADTYWESAAVTPAEVAIQLDLGQEVWLEQIDFDFDVLFQGELSLEYEQDGIWYPIQGWTRIAFSDLEDGQNGITLGEQGIITDQVRLVMYNTVNQAVLGRLCDVQIWGSRSESVSTDPQVVIAYPGDHSFVGNHSILQGYVKHSFTSVTLNGQTLANESGVFEMELNLAPERTNKKSSTNDANSKGSEVLEVVATNEHAQVASEQITVYMDTPPEVEILTPVDGLNSKEPQVLIEGTVDTNSYELTLNGQPISYYGNSFSYIYDLVPGLNLITVTAKDHKGLLGTDQVRIYYDAEVPLLGFAENYHEQIIGAESVMVYGTVYDYTPVELLINGTAFPVIQGNFVAELALPVEFENEFVVTVVDQAGNETEAGFTILRDMTPPVAFTPVAEPADWSQEVQPTITFATTDALAGVSHYERRIDGGEYQVVTSPDQLPELADGGHLIEIKAVDEIGWSTVGSVEVFVDTTPPESFVPTADPGDWNQETRPVIHFDTTDLHSGMNRYELKVDDGEYVEVTSSYRLPELADGVHTVYVKAVDNVGLETVETVQVFVDTTPAEVPATFKGVPGPEEVVLTWGRSQENDVTHYIMTREPGWSDGTTERRFENDELEYEYVDYDVVVGSSYSYELVVVDHADNISAPYATESPAGIIEKEIDPAEGGTVEYSTVTVEVPEGAMQETKLIEVKTKEVADVPEMVNQPVGKVVSLNLLDPVSKVTEEHVQFDEDLTLTFSYEDSDIPEGSGEIELDIYYYDEVRELWVKIPKVEHDLFSNTITVKVNHFTDFATQVTENYSPSAAEYRDMGLSPFGSYFQNNNEFVSPASGGLTVKTVDLKIPGPAGMDLEIGRIFNSQLAANKRLQKNKSTRNGYKAFNDGWMLNIPWISDDDKGLYFHTESGSAYEVQFKKHPASYNRNERSGFYFQAKKLNGKTIILLTSGLKYTFNEKGWIERKEDVNGNYISYDITDGKINSVNDAFGRSVSFTYDGDYIDYFMYNGQLYDFNYTSSDSTDHTADSEDMNRKLTEYVDPVGQSTKYEYIVKSMSYRSEVTGSKSVYIPEGYEDDEYHVGWNTLSTFTDNSYKSYPVSLINVITYPTGGISTYQYSIEGYSGLDGGTNNVTYGVYEYRENWDLSFTQNMKVVITGQKQYVNEVDYQQDQNPVKEKTYDYTLHSDSLAIATTSMTTPDFIKTVFGYTKNKGLNQKKEVYDLTREDVNFALEKTEYTYTNKSQVEEERVFRDGLMRFKLVYKYDNWGNVIYKENTANDSIVHYRYLNSDSRNLVWPDFLAPPVQNSSVNLRYDLVSDSFMVNASPVAGNTIIQTHYEYDSKGNMVAQHKYSSHDQEWYEERYEYNSKGLITKLIDVNENEITMAYSDELQGVYLTSTSRDVKRPKLNFTDSVETETITIHYGYDFMTGKKLWETDAKGNLTTYGYDPLGRLTKIVYPDDNDGTFNPIGNYSSTPSGVIRDDNPCKVQIYNDEGGFTTVANLVNNLEDVDQRLTEIVTQPLPNEPDQTNPVFNRTIYYYDSLNRLKETHKYLRPDELLPGEQNPVKTIFGYDAAGNQNLIIDAEGLLTLKEFDGMGRVTKITYPQIFTYPSGFEVPVTDIEYNDAFNREITTDANGGVTTVEKDWSGNIVKVSHTMGGITYVQEKVYDQLGQVVKDIDLNNQVTKHYRDSFGWLRKTVMPREDLVVAEGAITIGTSESSIVPTILYDYDRAGRKISEISPKGVAKYGSMASNYFGQETDFVTNYKYDEAGRLIKITNGTERTTWNFYDANNNVTKVVSTSGRIERNEYTATNLLRAKMIVDGLGEVVTDENGVVDYPSTWAESEEFDPDKSLVTYYEYSITGQPTKVLSPQGITPLPVSGVSESHDHTKNLFGIDWQLDPDYTVKTEYDALGRKRVVNQTIYGVEAKTYESRYDYDRVGNVIREINPANQVKEYHYNNLYMVDAEITYKQPFSSYDDWTSIDSSATVSPDTALVNRYVYDAVGNKRQSIDPEGKEKTYYYDEFNRLEMVQNELDENLLYDYDVFGNKTLEVDGANKQKLYTYDKLQNLKTVTEDNGAVTVYYYDLNGKVRGTVMADGYTKTMQYNEYGELIKEKRGTDPSINYQYDSAGNLMKVQDRKGQEIKIYYNRLGMPVKKEFYDVNGNLIDTNIFAYDRGGNQTNASNGNSSVEFTLNPLGQINEESQTIGNKSYAMSYAYDDAGSLTEITYPNATQPLTYEYNGYNRITGVSGSYDIVNGENSSSYQYSAAVEYTATGFMKKVKYSNNDSLLTTTLLTPDDLYRQQQILVIGHQC